MNKNRLLMLQYKELLNCIYTQPFILNKENINIFHISFQGSPATLFEEGIYHCEIDFTEYPEKAPSIQFLNDSGSYLLHQPVCIQGITSYHQEKWTPGTSVISIINALRVYMNEKDDRQALGFIKKLDEVQIKKYVQFSQKYKCSCGADHSKLFDQ
ncbi:Ubiquitin-conjugating enzyme E2 [Spironucleus salmonicida]|uniref:Ubiquitin-conjugating enzyme E2 n=1 Tax=Spironucleus salmonicida TaxID=348837 RepID=V6LWM4_9EUKA|nr:Ubiquitin-conjugating enzyme E2 [Spironucleus salmonicida]|eukprot:EST45184.1 Ubiquitin-conjugating enzyme E2 [Spironucleus salmonicida]